MRTLGLSLLLFLAVSSVVLVSPTLTVDGVTDRTVVRVSVSSAGDEADGPSLLAEVSADGRYVVFASDATNLVAGDSNGARDVFIRDLVAGVTELVSVATDGTQANAPSGQSAVSGDGRYVVFESDADNLVPDDTNGATDIFLRDRLLGTTIRVSLADDGSEANGDSTSPSISADGRFVTFTSRADNLVPDDTNGDLDVFLRDWQAGRTERVSVATDGAEGDFASGGFGAGPARISADGRYVVFGSFASTLVPDDTNARDDIFLRDRTLGTTERVSVGSSNEEGNGHSVYGDVSADGRYIVFASAASNLTPGDTNGLTDIFLRDRVTGMTTRLSLADSTSGNGPSRFPRTSADGRRIVFQSDASNLVPGDTNGVTDILVLNRTIGALERVSIAEDGTEALGQSTFPAVSADGRVIVFASLAPGLVADDSNGVSDVFAVIEAPPMTPTPTATVPAPPVATATATSTAPLPSSPSSTATPPVVVSLPKTGAGPSSPPVTLSLALALSAGVALAVGFASVLRRRA